MKKRLSFTYEECSLAELSDVDRNLLEAAISATSTAYAPYSGFHVGAALLLDNGTVVKGSNQENCAYPSGLCAERTALFSASATYPDSKVNALAIIARDTQGNLTAAFPCGACRQVMAEQQSRQNMKMRIICYCSETKILIFDGIESILPFAFAM